MKTDKIKLLGFAALLALFTGACASSDEAAGAPPAIIIERDQGSSPPIIIDRDADDDEDVDVDLDVDGQY